MPDITEEKIEEIENHWFESTDVVEQIGSQTLVAFMRKGPAPWDSGNCFSVSTPDGRSYRILNFNAENYNEFIRQNPELSGKIAIGVLDEGYALIIDARMNPEWDFAA